MIAMRSIRGISVLIRIVPVTSWSLCAILLSVGFAFHHLHSFRILHWQVLWLLVIGVILLQGVVAHSFNDRADWKSGTDKLTTGILSGGSRVIPKGFFNEKELLIIGLSALVASFGVGLYLNHLTTMWVWVFVATGVWSAISYTTPPFRLAYTPFLGEWLSAFPAMVACTLGTYVLLTSSIERSVVWAAIIHGLLCTAWLMQHHISDIPADLQASPLKRTTVVWVFEKWGLSKTIHVPAMYFLVGAFVSILATLAVAHMFLVSVVCSLLGAYASWNTKPDSIKSITYNQLKMIGITVAHSIFLFVLAIWTL